MMPLVIGLTGGIGCGKSHVRETLVALGAEGIDADKVAHEVMAPGGPAYEPLIAAFGPRRARGPTARSTGRSWARWYSATRLPWPGSRASSIPRSSRRPGPACRTAPRPLVVIEAIKLLEAGHERAACATRCGS